MMEYIPNICLGIVELTNIILCYSQIFHMKITKQKNRIFIWYIGICIINALNIYCDMQISVAFVNLLYGFATIWFVIDDKKWNAVKLYLCAYMMETIICFAVSYICAMVLDIPQVTFDGDIRLASLINSSFWIMMLIKIIVVKNSKKEPYEYKFGNAIYVALTVGSVSFLFILSAIQYFGDYFDIPYNHLDLLGFLLTCVCIIFYLLFFWLAKSIYKNEVYLRDREIMNVQMSEQEKYVGLIIEKNEDIRKFRHDIKEHMWVISNYLSKNEYERARNYINELYSYYDKVECVKYTGIIAVDAIISQKKKDMDSEGIEFIWEGSRCKIPEILEIFDLCTLFANILNNAIEACKSIDKASKKIEMQMRIDGDRIYIMERNRVAGEIRFDESGNPVSTKNDANRHGYGCKNIRNVVEKYEGELQFNVEDGIFEIEIVI